MFRHRIVVLVLLIFAVSNICIAQASAGNVPLKFVRLDKTFVSQGDRLGAWLYLPRGVAKPPVVVMAHGFGAQRWMRLPAYAERFAQRGMAVFVFDYRGFNDSEGTPRNYINPSRHLQDWEAAIAYVRGLKEVDGKRMALWGTSFSGGHVIAIAAKDHNISAVVAQVPFTDGITTVLSYFDNPMFVVKALYHGVWDVMDSIFTSHRHNVRIAGKPGEAFAMMSRPDTWDGMVRLLGNVDVAKFETENFCPANIVFTLMIYRPISSVEKITCPVLVIGAEKDTLFPPNGPKKAADRMQKATYISMPMGHFDPYVGAPFEKLVVTMGDFLQKQIGLIPAK
ncbi:MAG: alpha/beta fold hydrolase [Smithellaceae bacterium]|nr:alpha/beta fold hydrolase [Smithellaceae bacterium]